MGQDSHPHKKGRDSAALPKVSQKKVIEKSLRLRLKATRLGEYAFSIIYIAVRCRGYGKRETRGLGHFVGTDVC